MNRAYLLLGTNLGNKAANLQKALTQLSQKAGSVLKSSAVYETEAWGIEGDSFLNQVVLLETTLLPDALMEEMLQIESAMGRERSGKGPASRTIDLDILFFNDLVLQSEAVTLPHPRLHLRRFTLVPLNEIAPAHPHPWLGKTVGQLLAECKDLSGVKILENSTLS